MCWKREWEMAINNLKRAVTHIERALVKVEQRTLRNQQTLENLSRAKRESEKKVVEGLLGKNRAAEWECRVIIADLKERQSQLQRMIQTYSISRKSSK